MQCSQLNSCRLIETFRCFYRIVPFLDIRLHVGDSLPAYQMNLIDGRKDLLATHTEFIAQNLDLLSEPLRALCPAIESLEHFAAILHNRPVASFESGVQLLL